MTTNLSTEGPTELDAEGARPGQTPTHEPSGDGDRMPPGEVARESGGPEVAEADGVPASGRRTLADRIEAFVSRLSTRNNFWHRVCSLIWLPYAFRSGIRMKRIDDKTFQAVLPYKKFNRNWYNAMAGAALVGNSEIAGGMYIFGVCGGAYTVVCKELSYRFLRPCFGPALYRVHPREDIQALAASGKEFNVTLTMDVVQHLPRADQLPKVREKRVGRVTVTFHATPKSHQKAKRGGFKASRKVVREGEAINIHE